MVISFFKKKGFIEDPKLRKKIFTNVTHTSPVPRGGGIPIFLAIFTTAFIFLPADPILKIIFLAAFLNLAIGIIDDIKDINPYFRLFINFAAAFLIAFAGVRIKFFTNPAGGIILLEKSQITLLSLLITVFWIVWCTNIVGWAGGVPGQLPGFTAITAATIGLLSLKFSQDLTQWPVIILAGVASGAFFGFLPYNFYPQKIMPGYSGKSLAGFLLAVLAILSGAKLATAILVLGVPMADGFFSILRRILRKKSPVWADAGHLHHLMLKAGIPKPLIAVLYWLFSLVLGFIVLNLNSKQKVYALIMLVVFVGFLFLSLKKVIKKKTKRK